MTKIQLVLLASSLLLLLLYLRLFRNRIFITLFFLGFFTMGILFVIHPSLAQQTAAFFGVGRGVDLVIYFLLVSFFFLFIALFYKTRHLGKTIVDLVRNRAIENARNPGDN
ncbi:MAG: DUF2304 domain-containing protein [Ferruginibacter sp.]